MFNTFKYVALSLARDKGIMIWSLMFPIILSTCFIFMFEGIDNMDSVDPVPVVVVEDENYENAQAFKMFIHGISGESEAIENEDIETYIGQNAQNIPDISSVEGLAENDFDKYENEESEALLSITYAPTTSEAENLLWESEQTENPYVGYIMVDKDGMPQLFARSISSATGLEEIDREILLMSLDIYKSKANLFLSIVENDPYALTNPQVLSSVFDNADVTEKISVTLNSPKESVRYYFALLGMAALFGAQSGLTAVMRLLPNMGPLGARRELGSTAHSAALAGTILASWAISTVCLLVAYIYIRFIAGVDFAGRDAECVLAIAICSLMATSLGAFLGSIPKLPIGARIGFLTIIVCLASFFAGLYGQPTMELADTIAKNFPISQYVNPAVQISQTFYSIMYYDNIGPLLGHIGILLIFTVVFFVLSANFLRKQRYASL